MSLIYRKQKTIGPYEKRAKNLQVKKSAHEADFLLEIGTEELPWRVIQPTLENLRQRIDQLLADNRITHGVVRSFGTPRRLAFIVEGLAGRQSPIHQELWGPPKSVAFDSEGNPTKAAEGFAKTQGISIRDVQIRTTTKGEYLCVVKEDRGRLSREVLREVIPKALEGLSFPKSMRWNDSGIRFARPIRWVVAMAGSQVLRLKVAGIVAGNHSWGHRFWSRNRTRREHPITIRSCRSYVKELERAGVWVDPDCRRSMLRKQLRTLAKSVKGHVYSENKEELLEEAVFSQECPNAIVGKFNAAYLELPREILITSMKVHQGFFPIVGAHGDLLARFIAPTNMDLRDMGLIRKGNERVLAARLADARYFFDEDRKSKLVDRLEQLKGVIFHKKLGTLFQKTERMVPVSAVLADTGGLGHLKEACQRAALLSKADLTTGMVGEFPTLQGIMGREYAKQDGESDTVCEAIGEQYFPKLPDDQIPQSPVGQILSLTDRLDTLAAFFRANVSPSGSEDPFGLRRQAFGLVRILIEGNLGINLIEIIQRVNHQLNVQGVLQTGLNGNGSEEIGPIQTLLEFVGERIRFYGRKQSGFRDDVMDAVLQGRQRDVFDILDLFARMQALQYMTGQEEFDPLMVGFKRAHRLVEKEEWSKDEVNAELFEDQSERSLHSALMHAQQAVVDSLKNRQYGQALEDLIALKPSIDDFFTGVLVNAPDHPVRSNRLSLLYRVDRLFLMFADFSRIQVQGA